ncbi:hypothetical protein PPL_00438 [Heterostelium album PN500]|uniref:Pesticidal crystal protein domain-containing protein n=1 Tax=Heterostelium pallidum (strain ATCC 26659 / Pp 5 / PN500) TaxID=670386 RepID=D3AWG4_HETP5|nr:hypothetical protein PPL_00438 [Heterostelium album PN500]EFA86637.1 hypothetical protein PPL_00438 [Heterostelium album PN500]|eukprot:XP_020438742.1 hypothetical protein PPL_00438 [Heterostelium album PN500]
MYLILSSGQCPVPPNCVDGSSGGPVPCGDDPSSNVLVSQLEMQQQLSDIGNAIENAIYYLDIIDPEMIPVGPLVSSLVYHFWPTGPSIVVSLTNYVDSIVSRSIMCQSYSQSLNLFENMNCGAQTYSYCFNSYLKGCQPLESICPSRLEVYSRMDTMLSINANSFGGPGFAYIDFQNQLALLPIYIQYINLRLSFFRDMILHPDIFNFTINDTIQFQNEISVLQAHATQYANQIAMTQLNGFPKISCLSTTGSKCVTVDVYNQLANYTLSVVTGVLKYSDMWPYFDPIKYPLGPPPTKPRSILTPIVGNYYTTANNDVCIQNYADIFYPDLSFVNSSSLSPSNTINVYKNSEFIQCINRVHCAPTPVFFSAKTFYGIAGLKFENNLISSSMVYGADTSHHDVHSAGTLVVNNFLSENTYKILISSIKTFYPKKGTGLDTEFTYIQAIQMGLSAGLEPIQTTGVLSSDHADSNLQSTNSSFIGFYLSGVSYTQQSTYSICTNQRPNTLNAISYIFTDYTGLIPSKPAIDNTKIYQYSRIQSDGNVRYLYTAHNYDQTNLLSGWTFDGPAFGGLTFGFTNTTYPTKTVYQYSFSSAISVGTRYLYATNGGNAQAWTFDYPVFNVYSDGSLPGTIPVYRLGQAGQGSSGVSFALSTESYLPDWITVGVVWYTPQNQTLPNATIATWKPIANVGNSGQCLSSSTGTNSLVVVECSQNKFPFPDSKQVWKRLSPYQNNSQLLNYNLQTVSGTNQNSNPILVPLSNNNDQSTLVKFIYTPSKYPSYQIQSKITGQCIQMVAKPGGGYTLQYSNCNSDNLFQWWNSIDLRLKTIQTNGYCLTYSTDSSLSTPNPAGPSILPCFGGYIYQAWFVNADTISSKAGSLTQSFVDSWNSTPNKFYFTSGLGASATKLKYIQVPNSNTFQIQNVQTGLCLELVPNNLIGSRASFTGCDSSISNQKWTFSNY